MEFLKNLMMIDLTITTGVLLGTAIWMKKTGESFQQVCLRILRIFSGK